MTKFTIHGASPDALMIIPYKNSKVMNELQITIHNWRHLSDKDVNVFIRIALLELYEKNIDYDRVKEYHREFTTHGIELYLKWK